jgi:hypothetical protein
MIFTGCGKTQSQVSQRRMPGQCERIPMRKHFRNPPILPDRLAASALWVVWLFLIPHQTEGQTPSNTTPAQLPPGIGIQIEAIPKIGAVGDPIWINLDVKMPPGYTIEIPKPETQTNDFAILDFLPGPVVPDRGKPHEPTQPAPARTGTPQHHRAQILIAIYRTGRFAFPPIPMKLKTAEGVGLEIASPSIDIEIQSVLNDKDRALKDIKRQAEIPESRPWYLWLLLALACCILGALAGRFLKRRRSRPVSLSPVRTRDLLDLAEADLKDLLARGFPNSGMEKQFYVLLSEIVKRILEPAYEIHTTEKTTSEIMDSLLRSSALEPENTGLIESFLVRCDIVKFAKYVPSQSEHESAAKDALQILAEARKAVAKHQSSVGSEHVPVGIG